MIGRQPGYDGGLLGDLMKQYGGMMGGDFDGLSQPPPDPSGSLSFRVTAAGHSDAGGFSRDFGLRAVEGAGDAEQLSDPL